MSKLCQHGICVRVWACSTTFDIARAGDDATGVGGPPWTGPPWPTRDGDVWLPVAPFTHIYGYLMGVTNPLLRGGTLVIPPQFQPALVVDMLTEHRVTVFGGGPPAIYQAVLAAPNFQSADLSHLRVCPGGGARDARRPEPAPVARLRLRRVRLCPIANRNRA